MHALLSDPNLPFAVLGEADDPRPRDNQALIDVKAFSLNRGETRRLESMPRGSVTGWDLAGVVAAPAADGTGPKAGARVVGFTQSGAWAERAAVCTEHLAQIPDAVTTEQASTLPVAGLTALRAFEVGGFVLGKRVLVTGASGGVGRFAIQLGKRAGAHVTAVARRHAGLQELGADDVLDAVEPGGENFDLILDAIGGPVLGVALQRVAPRGTVVSFASTVTEPVSYPTRELFARAPGARLYGLFIFDELRHTRSAGADLRRLAELIADGRLEAPIDLVRSWRQAGEAIEALLDRRVAGKAVLTVD